MKTHGADGYIRKRFFCRVVISAMLALGGGSSWAAPNGSPWGKGYFPNVELVNQDGKTVRFYDDLIEDRVVVINFIYTRCGDSCPMQTANLRQVYKLLADRMGKDIFFYSISIDPEHDSPKMLKEYADRFSIGSDSGWSFLTGSKADTTLLRNKLGLFRDGVEASKLDEHNTSFLLGNETTGQWIKRSSFDEPKVLAWLLGRSLSHAKVDRKSGLASYAQADRIPRMSKGEDLFRSRCDSCHSLGSEDGLGPGLLHVTERRDRAWLIRWLKSPGQLLAGKDPIALELFSRYKGLEMPDLKLGDSDVDALISYIEANSKAARKGAVGN